MLWLPDDEVDCAAQQGQPEQLAKQSVQQIDGPTLRLPPIAEGPSALTMDTMFVHDEPTWKSAVLEVVCGHLARYSHCQDITATPEGDIAECDWVCLVTECNESLTTSTMAESYSTVTVPTAAEAYLESYYTMDAAQLTYKDIRGGRQAEPALPRPADHFCMRIHSASEAAQTVVQRNDALLTIENPNMRPIVVQNIRQEPDTWIRHGCTSRRKRKRARNAIVVKWALTWRRYLGGSKRVGRSDRSPHGGSWENS